MAEQIKLDQMGGDPRKVGSAEDDIKFLREGGQTDYKELYDSEADPYDDGAKTGQERYAVAPERYPVNQSIGTKIVTGRWDVPFVAGLDCELLTPLRPDPLTGYGRKSIMIYNNSSVFVYLGMSNDVSINRDWPIPPAGNFVIDKDASTGIWMISTPSVVADVRFALEMGYVGSFQGRVS
jgi:hypothetical protein